MASSEFQQIVNDFDFLEDWEDRYRYIIDLGKKLDPLDSSLKNETTKVNGCASQVWMTYELIGEEKLKSIDLRGESDALIVKGLIAILIALYSGTLITEAARIDPLAEFNKLGLNEHLSSQRSNGLRAMLDRITSIIQIHQAS
jgi:cysteine desulfuration protein SufE